MNLQLAERIRLPRLPRMEAGDWEHYADSLAVELRRRYAGDEATQVLTASLGDLARKFRQRCESPQWLSDVQNFGAAVGHSQRAKGETRRPSSAEGVWAFLPESIDELMDEYLARGGDLPVKDSCELILEMLRTIADINGHTFQDAPDMAPAYFVLYVASVLTERVGRLMPFLWYMTYLKVKANRAGRDIAEIHALLSRYRILCLLELYPAGVASYLVDFHGEELFRLEGCERFVNRYYHTALVSPQDTLASLIAQRWRFIPLKIRPKQEDIVAGLCDHPDNPQLKGVGIHEPLLKRGIHQFVWIPPKSQDEAYQARVAEYGKQLSLRLVHGGKWVVGNHTLDWAVERSSGTGHSGGIKLALFPRKAHLAQVPGEIDLSESNDSYELVRQFNGELRNVLGDQHARLRSLFGRVAGQRLPNIESQRKFAQAVNWTLERLAVGFKFPQDQRIYRLRVVRNNQSNQGSFEFQSGDRHVRGRSVCIPDLAPLELKEVPSAAHGA